MLPFAWIGTRSLRGGRLPGISALGNRKAEQFHESRDCLSGTGNYRSSVVVVDNLEVRRERRRKEGPRTIELGFYFSESRCCQLAWRCAITAFTRLGRPIDLWHGTVFDNEPTWRNERGYLSVAKFLEQTKNVAINRLLPDSLSGIEITADQHRIDARVECCA